MLELAASKYRLAELEGELALARCRETARRIAGIGYKAARSGWSSSITAVVSVLGVVDRDADLVMPGSLTTTKAIVSEWNHSAMEEKGGDPPVGSALLSELGDTSWSRGSRSTTRRAAGARASGSSASARTGRSVQDPEGAAPDRGGGGA